MLNSSRDVGDELVGTAGLRMSPPSHEAAIPGCGAKLYGYRGKSWAGPELSVSAAPALA